MLITKQIPDIICCSDILMREKSEESTDISRIFCVKVRQFY